MLSCICVFFFFNDTATTEIYTLSLHDALPIFARGARVSAGEAHGCPGREDRGDIHRLGRARLRRGVDLLTPAIVRRKRARSEEHTSELQSRLHLVCRLLLEKKKTKRILESKDD